jgi:tRNA(adenine34) deaminase
MCTTATPEQLVRLAMNLAAQAAARGDPPFGAVLVSPLGEVILTASNRQVSSNDPTAHAELELLRAGARAGIRSPLVGYTVATNAEPCSMCASALVKSGVSALVYGAPHEPHMDPNLGLADVLARSRNPPHVTASILAAEAAAQIASLRATSGSRPPD